MTQQSFHYLQDWDVGGIFGGEEGSISYTNVECIIRCSKHEQKWTIDSTHGALSDKNSITSSPNDSKAD